MTRSRTSPQFHEKRASTGGFTLVEVLLAAAIAGLLFTGAFWSLQQAISMRNELSNIATPYIVGPAILDVLQGDLANVYFYDLKENNCFYGSDAELAGREADAISFVTLSKTYAPERYAQDDERDSFANEVSYVLRTGAPGTPFYELWRREDFFVDDRPHSDGDYVMLYDKVHSISIKYISRNPEGESGVGGSSEKSAEEMLQDGWNSIKERGVPRAIQITINIFAQDSDMATDLKIATDGSRIYTFQRYLTLPQVHMSLESEQQIATWDGKYNETRGNRAANKAGAQAGAQGVPGAPQPGARGGAGARRRGQRGGAQPGQGGQSGANNPFMQALRGQSGGGRPAGNGAGLQQLFGGGR